VIRSNFIAARQPISPGTVVPAPILTFALRAVVAVIMAAAIAASAQSAEKLSQVRNLYVEPFGQDKSAIEMRSQIIRRLEKTREFKVVNAPAAADAVMKATEQIWTVGHVALSPHLQNTNQPMLEGFLSAEIVGSHNQTLWSYLVTPSRFVWGGIASDLARQLVSRLAADVNTQGSSPAETSASAAATATLTLKGAGATFPAPLYRRWFELFEEDHPGIHISYDAVGSGEGIDRLRRGETDFGASEMPLSAESAGAGHFIQVPVVLGAVVPIYNLEHVKRQINFTPEILAGIYLGQIRKWSDARIRAANRGASLPDADIVVFHRSDASGTSYVWSEYLSKVSAEWKSKVGHGVTVSWPVGAGEAYNDGVAAAVQRTPNSIGYVEFIYAIQHELGFAAVRNAAGEFVKADIASVMEAARSTGPADHGFQMSITDPPGKNSYPIATYTWLLLPEDIGDSNRKSVLVELSRWMLTSGQKSCSGLGYAPLPAEVAKRGLQSVDQANAAAAAGQ
jgi:phosphate transport system substrate-binding protein